MLTVPQRCKARNRNMTQLAATRAERRSGVKCRGCGGAMRLFGSEPHPTWVDLLAYVCDRCDGVQTQIVTPAKLEPMGTLLTDKAFDAEMTHVLGAAFDAAWERVAATNGLPADKGQMAAMRELLAKFIIAKAEQGEKDPKRLIETALLRLRLMRNAPE